MPTLGTVTLAFTRGQIGDRVPVRSNFEALRNPFLSVFGESCEVGFDEGRVIGGARGTRERGDGRGVVGGEVEGRGIGQSREVERSWVEIHNVGPRFRLRSIISFINANWCK